VPFSCLQVEAVPGVLLVVGEAEAKFYVMSRRIVEQTSFPNGRIEVEPSFWFVSPFPRSMAMHRFMRDESFIKVMIQSTPT